MFKWKSLPGWLLAVLGPCWQLIRNLATTDFVIRKLGLEKQMTPILATIASWPYLPVALSAIGIIWIWWSSRPKKETFISLTKAVETLIDAGKQKQIIKGMGYLMEMQNDADSYYEQFGKLIAQKTDIYGKRPSFNKYEPISENMILIGDFSNLCSKLYLNKELLFIDLAIRGMAFDKTIQEIVSSDRPFPWLNYVVIIGE